MVCAYLSSLEKSHLCMGLSHTKVGFKKLIHVATIGLQGTCTGVRARVGYRVTGHGYRGCASGKRVNSRSWHNKRMLYVVNKGREARGSM